jgi:hypothetical protein
MLDAEIALFAPIWIPAVGNLPIIHTIVNSPSNDFHGMSTCHFSRDVVIDPTSIVLEVAVHCEGCLNWTTSHDQLLNLPHPRGRDNLP